jgi:hypothetical protein
MKRAMIAGGLDHIHTSILDAKMLFNAGNIDKAHQAVRKLREEIGWLEDTLLNQYEISIMENK